MREQQSMQKNPTVGGPFVKRALKFGALLSKEPYIIREPETVRHPVSGVPDNTLVNTPVNTTLLQALVFMVKAHTNTASLAYSKNTVLILLVVARSKLMCL